MSKVEHRLRVKFSYYGQEIIVDSISHQNVQQAFDKHSTGENVDYIIWESRVIPDWKIVRQTRFT